MEEEDEVRGGAGPSRGGGGASLDDVQRELMRDSDVEDALDDFERQVESGVDGGGSVEGGDDGGISGGGGQAGPSSALSDYE